MPTFDITIDGKTYHVDIPWLGVEALPVIVDGKPFEIRFNNEQSRAPGEARQADEPARFIGAGVGANGKPVRAVWHASIWAE